MWSLIVQSIHRCVAIFKNRKCHKIPTYLVLEISFSMTNMANKMSLVSITHYFIVTICLLSTIHIHMPHNAENLWTGTEYLQHLTLLPSIHTLTHHWLESRHVIYLSLWSNSIQPFFHWQYKPLTSWDTEGHMIIMCIMRSKETWVSNDVVH